MEMSPEKSLLVACGGEVVVVATRNVVAASDVADAIGIMAADDVVVVVGASVVVAIWVQWC